MEGLGERIRDERKARRLRLQTVAERTGLTASFLSQVERSVAAPSLTSLALIAQALGVPVQDFMRPPKATSKISRQQARPGFGADPSKIRYERLSTSMPGSALHGLKLLAAPFYRSEVTSHPGEEFIYVLSGNIRYVIDGQPFDLAAGDTLHFLSKDRHHVENITADPAEYISIGTFDIFGEGPSAEALKTKVTRPAPGATAARTKRQRPDHPSDTKAI